MGLSVEGWLVASVLMRKRIMLPAHDIQWLPEPPSFPCNPKTISAIEHDIRNVARSE
jgi:hypothetical protein